MLLHKILSFLVAGLFLSSCGNYLVQKTKEPVVNQTAQENLPPDFALVKDLVFSPRCVSCHQQYNTYQGVIRELTAIQEAVASNRMPKSGGPLTDSQKAVLAAWIAKGAPDQPGGSDKANLPLVLEPNWDSISENVIFPKCLVCHNPQGQAKFLDLSTRKSFFDSRNRVFGDSKLIDFEAPQSSYLIQVLLDDEEPMPPIWSKIPRLTQDELETLIQWLSLGLP